uniref:Uncharacterized protein n=1 Tax=Anguilla anguilla TaxID=7936 RepID=A0A0E9VF48_ANGAN
MSVLRWLCSLKVAGSIPGYDTVMEPFNKVLNLRCLSIYPAV